MKRRNHVNILLWSCAFIFLFLWKAKTFEPLSRNSCHQPILEGGLNIHNIKLQHPISELIKLKKFKTGGYRPWKAFYSYMYGIRLYNYDKSIYNGANKHKLHLNNNQSANAGIVIDYVKANKQIRWNKFRRMYVYCIVYRSHF